MRKLLQWIEARTDDQQTKKLMDRVAQRSQPAVWRRVYPLIEQMGHYQACGYIRARSAAVVRRELRLAAADSSSVFDQTPQLFELAIQRVVRDTMKALSQQLPVTAGRAA